jgi:hypothetical protein
MNTINFDTLRTIRYIIATSDLPVLVGTPNDIEQAGMLRIDRLTEIHHLLVSRRTASQEGERHPTEDTSQATARIRNMTAATWWIAQRSKSTSALLDECSHQATRSYIMESGNFK